MKPLSRAGISLGLGLLAGPLLAGASAFAAPPPTAPSSAWDGTYVYEQSLGRGAGGVENFVTHTLKIGGAEGCRLVAQGYQTPTTRSAARQCPMATGCWSPS